MEFWKNVKKRTSNKELSLFVFRDIDDTDADRLVADGFEVGAGPTWGANVIRF